jgi:hypothetical protein
MNKNLVTMRFAGIDFLLDVDINMSGEYEGLFGVSVWNNVTQKYVTIPCDLTEFENTMQDQIFEAVEAWQLDNHLFAADMIYEAVRERL